jgi:hypothetical protein
VISHSSINLSQTIWADSLKVLGSHDDVAGGYVVADGVIEQRL